MYKVYVDGQHGTTGLLVNERLLKHPKVEILKIDYDKRHNEESRKELINKADIVFLCLPDDAAKESVKLIENDKTKVIDASTAHRCNKDWAYGFAELSDEHRTKIIEAKRVSNPGCHASAAISILYPLVKENVLNKEEYINLFSITGYSGGGKKMINTYETTDNMAYRAPRQYGLTLKHKHLNEITLRSGLITKPIFMPVVSAYKRGLAVTLPLYIEQLNVKNKKDVIELYKKHYKDSKFIRVHDINEQDLLVDNCFNIQMNNDTNYLDIFLYGNDEQINIIACLDNLGKGASGAAIQNMNIMLGLDEGLGL